MKVNVRRPNLRSAIDPVIVKIRRTTPSMIVQVCLSHVVPDSWNIVTAYEVMAVPPENRQNRKYVNRMPMGFSVAGLASSAKVCLAVIFLELKTKF
jgi:hypothetical protein